MTWYKKTGWGTAKTTKGLDGVWYDSLFEASYGNELFAKKKLGEIKDYESHVRFPLFAINEIGEKYNMGQYTADFVVYHNNGDKEIVETKGMISEAFSLRWKIVEMWYAHEYILTMVKQGKGKVRHPKKVIEF